MKVIRTASSIVLLSSFLIALSTYPHFADKMARYTKIKHDLEDKLEESKNKVLKATKYTEANTAFQEYFAALEEHSEIPEFNQAVAEIASLKAIFADIASRTDSPSKQVIELEPLKSQFQRSTIPPPHYWAKHSVGGDGNCFWLAMGIAFLASISGTGILVHSYQAIPEGKGRKSTKFPSVQLSTVLGILTVSYIPLILFAYELPSLGFNTSFMAASMGAIGAGFYYYLAIEQYDGRSKGNWHDSSVLTS